VALDYQQLLEQALTRKGIDTPSVSSVSNVTPRFSKNTTGTSGIDTPSVSSVSNVTPRFSKNTTGTSGIDTPSVSSVSNVTPRFSKNTTGTSGIDTPSVSSVSNVTKHFSENHDDGYKEAWEERAAIMEFDGELTRITAEVQATVTCQKWYRNIQEKRPVS
jgi:hypothetical protein